MTRWLLAIATFFLLTVSARAATCPTGWTCTPWSQVTPPTYNTIDATQSAGADMCAKISAAAATLAASYPGGGNIDARGFTGTQNCAGNMFSPWPASPFFGQVTLSCNVTIVTAVSVVIPSFTGLTGSCPYNDDQGPGGAIIQAANTFPTSTPLVDLGVSGAAFGIKLYLVALKCYTPGGTTPTGSIGLRNFHSQEQTHVDNVIIRGCVDGLVIAGQIGDGNDYQHIYVSDTPGAGGSSWHCLRVGDPSQTTQSNGLFDINYFECNTSGALMTNKIMLDGHNYSLRHVYAENNGGTGVTNWICVGCQASPTPGPYNITVEDVACVGSTTAASGSACIALQSGANFGTFNFMNIQAQPSGTMYTINDGASPGTGCQIVSGFSAGQEFILSFYSRGTQGRIVNTSSACPKP